LAAQKAGVGTLPVPNGGHATRHTGAKMRLDQQAPIKAIQEQLMHSSLHTTTLYIDAVQTGENQYAAMVADAFDFN
jgi:integrase